MRHLPVLRIQDTGARKSPVSILDHYCVGVHYLDAAWLCAAGDRVGQQTQPNEYHFKKLLRYLRLNYCFLSLRIRFLDRSQRWHDWKSVLFRPQLRQLGLPGLVL